MGGAKRCMAGADSRTEAARVGSLVVSSSKATCRSGGTEHIVGNPIDNFVHAKLEQEHVQPSPDADRATLAEIRRRLGRKGLQPVARLAQPDTILAWYRKLVAEKFDGSIPRRSPGRPRTSPEIEALVVRFARENSGWGYDRIVGALANLGYRVSDRTVGNILRRRGIAPVPERSQTTT
jgi:hypothetical protein